MAQLRPPIHQESLTTMSQIPITKDYAATVGDWCEHVENRSLLLNKFAFPKNWGVIEKKDDASRWSLMRVAYNGKALLTKEASELRKKAAKWEHRANDPREREKTTETLR